MLASRAPIIAELLIAGVATALLALSSSSSPPSPPPKPKCECERVVHVELMSPPAAKLDCTAPLTPTLAAMFEHRDFAALDRALDGCRDAQELLHQLAHDWATALDTRERTGDRFDATRAAIKLDIAFGGAHVDELTHLLADIARESRIQLSGELSPAAKKAAQ